MGAAESASRQDAENIGHVGPWRITVFLMRNQLLTFMEPTCIVFLCVADGILFVSIQNAKVDVLVA